MAAKFEVIKTNVTIIDAVLILLAGLAGGATGAPWTGLLCALAAGIAIGVWRAVRMLGKIMEYVQELALRGEDE